MATVGLPAAPWDMEPTSWGQKWVDMVMRKKGMLACAILVGYATPGLQVAFMAGLIKMKTEAEQEALGESFRQSRRELWFILVTWLVFASWVTVGCGLTAFEVGEEGQVAVLWGMPRWVVGSVLLPWLVANGVIFYFAAVFMKDTDLGEEEVGS
jgi:hypothetical protein